MKLNTPLTEEACDRLARHVWSVRSGKKQYDNEAFHHDVVYCQSERGDQVRVYRHGELIHTKDATGNEGVPYETLGKIKWRVSSLWKRINRCREVGMFPICGATRLDTGLCQGRPEPPNERCSKHLGGTRVSQHPSRKLIHVSEVEVV